MCLNVSFLPKGRVNIGIAPLVLAFTGAAGASCGERHAASFRGSVGGSELRRKGTAHRLHDVVAGVDVLGDLVDGREGAREDARDRGAEVSRDDKHRAHVDVGGEKGARVRPRDCEREQHDHERAAEPMQASGQDRVGYLPLVRLNGNDEGLIPLP